MRYPIRDSGAEAEDHMFFSWETVQLVCTLLPAWTCFLGLVVHVCGWGGIFLSNLPEPAPFWSCCSFAKLTPAEFKNPLSPRSKSKEECWTGLYDGCLCGMQVACPGSVDRRCFLSKSKTKAQVRKWWRRQATQTQCHTGIPGLPWSILFLKMFWSDLQSLLMLEACLPSSLLCFRKRAKTEPVQVGF